ncbi:MAG: polysaccharide deacetylase family protein [Propionibacteriaceae bacterium]|nr:polysaccharide deacetylase family protein [Propionibacteriaceae bacterium]
MAILTGEFTRRTLLAAGAVTALAGLAGCGQEPREASVQPSPQPDPASASPTPTPTPSAAAVPTKAELVQAYAGRVPTQWGTDVTGVVSRTPAPGVLLTLDLCGGPGGAALDQRIVDLLVEYAVPAGVFVNARWIDANPGAVERLIATGVIEMGNHGTSHRPLSVTGRAAYGINGTADVGAVVDEVLTCHDRLTTLTGTAPRWFRSGTAHYDEVAVDILRAVGEVPVGFSVNGDAGATASATAVDQAVRGAKPGDIVIAHANHPNAATFTGLARALPAMVANGTRFLRLSEADLT